jgi:membrane-associated phospholipid phosphatase
MIWSHISALGGLTVTAILALAIALWLVGARCWRLALVFCTLLAGAMLLAVATQVAFIGWGLGLRGLDFTGFSGHATRAAAVYPVALFVLLERGRGWRRRLGVAGGALLAALVALARVKVGAHSVSEAASGFALGLAAALLFVAWARTNRRSSPKPLLVGGLLLATLLLPRAEPASSHQWVTALALKLAHQDRPWTRYGWRQEDWPYVPPCEPDKLRFEYFCT